MDNYHGTSFEPQSKPNDDEYPDPTPYPTEEMRDVDDR
jgi:hypothetical protein